MITDCIDRLFPEVRYEVAADQRCRALIEALSPLAPLNLPLKLLDEFLSYSFERALHGTKAMVGSIRGVTPNFVGLSPGLTFVAGTKRPPDLAFAANAEPNPPIRAPLALEHLEIFFACLGHSLHPCNS